MEPSERRDTTSKEYTIDVMRFMQRRESDGEVMQLCKASEDSINGSMGARTAEQSSTLRRDDLTGGHSMEPRDRSRGRPTSALSKIVVSVHTPNSCCEETHQGEQRRHPGTQRVSAQHELCMLVLNE